MPLDPQAEVILGLIKQAGLPEMWQLTPDQAREQYALRVAKLADALPRKPSGFAIAKQMARSGTSAAANYRAACLARSKAEFIAKAGDCLKEIDETGYWLELLVDEGFVPERRMRSLLQETEELIAIFTSIVKRSKGE